MLATVSWIHCVPQLGLNAWTMGPVTQPFLSAFSRFSFILCRRFLNMAVFVATRSLRTSIINTPNGCLGYLQISSGANSVTLLSWQSGDKTKDEGKFHKPRWCIVLLCAWLAWQISLFCKWQHYQYAFDCFFFTKTYSNSLCSRNSQPLWFPRLLFSITWGGFEGMLINDSVW